MFDFTDEQRRIFSYSNGAAQMLGDPLDLDMRLKEALEFRWSEICEDAQPLDSNGMPRPEPTVVAAHKKLVAGTIQAFDLIPFDPVTGTGCTTAMVMAVYNAFVDFQNGLKKKLSDSSASPPPSPPLPPGFYQTP